GTAEARPPRGAGDGGEPGTLLRPLRRSRAAERPDRRAARAARHANDERLRQDAEGAREDPRRPGTRRAAVAPRLHARARRHAAPYGPGRRGPPPCGVPDTCLTRVWYRR